jgi:hypothetical protein
MVAKTRTVGGQYEVTTSDETLNQRRALDWWKKMSKGEPSSFCSSIKSPAQLGDLVGYWTSYNSSEYPRGPSRRLEYADKL